MLRIDVQDEQIRLDEGPYSQLDIRGTTQELEVSIWCDLRMQLGEDPCQYALVRQRRRWRNDLLPVQ